MANLRSEQGTESSAAFPERRRLIERNSGDRNAASLASRTRDGLVIEPLYPPRTDAMPLPGRGSGPWTIVQIIDDPDPDRANEQALADVAGGATGLALRFAGGVFSAGRGLPVIADAISVALDRIDLAAIRLRIDPHVQSPKIAGWMRDLAARRGVAPELTGIHFGLDPASPLAADSSAGPDEAGLVGMFQALREAGFVGPLAELDARFVQAAGGTEAQELAVVLASATWWLRVLEAVGLNPSATLPCLGASLAIDQDQFLSIAKLRALRLLWARLQELCGAASTHLPIHAETAWRTMSRAAPYANILRQSIGALAAGVAGADSLAVLPYDAALGPGDAAARALARNMQHLLIDESNVYRVCDPGAGSGAVESLTDQLAAAAWAEFQSIEREGGMLESLRSGPLRARILRSQEALRTDVANGTTRLVGVTHYPDPTANTPVATRAQLAKPADGLAPVRLEEWVTS